MQREAIFVDGSYIDKIVKNRMPGKNLNYAHLVSSLRTQKYEILRSYYYHCRPYKSESPTEKEEKLRADMNRFFDRLSNIPKFEVKFGKLQKIGNTFK